MTEITPQEAAAHKQRIAQVFDQVSTGYDSPALRFFPSPPTAW
jgi:hypothetical protein